MSFKGAHAAPAGFPTVELGLAGASSTPQLPTTASVDRSSANLMWTSLRTDRVAADYDIDLRRCIGSHLIARGATQHDAR